MNNTIVERIQFISYAHKSSLANKAKQTLVITTNADYSSSSYYYYSFSPPFILCISLVVMNLITRALYAVTTCQIATSHAVQTVRYFTLLQILHDVINRLKTRSYS